MELKHGHALWAKRAWATCAAMLALAGALGGCGGPPRQAELGARVDALLAPLVAARQFSGAVVLVQRGRVVYERGFGLANHAAGLAFTPRTPSDGASLAKTFTAAGLMSLVQEGRVELDAPVTRYLPEFPHAQTTVRQLLSHSNGLPPDYGFFDPHFKPDQVRSTEAMLRVVAREQPAPAFAPGSRFEYSNFGYDLAALLIERISGQDYESFVRQRYFRPLGLVDSFARPARLADWKGVRTLGYRWRDAAWAPVEVYDMEGFLGASNLYFSAADLARWAAAHAAGTALPAAVQRAGEQPSLIAGQPSAIDMLSWYCDAQRQRCHYTGSLNAFHSLVYWDRERNEAVVFVSNSSLPPWPTINLQRDLADALAGRPARTEPSPAFQRFERAAHAAVTGRYAAPGLGSVTVSGGDAAALLVRIDAGLEYQAYAVSREVWYVPGTDHWLAFSGGARPTALHLRGMYIDAVAPRIDPLAAPAAAASPQARGR